MCGCTLLLCAVAEGEGGRKVLCVTEEAAEAAEEGVGEEVESPQRV